MGSDDTPVETPPEGAFCAEHEDRPALAVCPRCGSYTCLACWHGSLRRCHQCLLRDPLDAAPPVPWEQPTLGPLGRYFGTLRGAFRPYATGPSFGRGGWTPAATFFLASFVPLAMLAGVIPFTQLLVFGPSLTFVTVGEPTSGALVSDIMGASLLGLLLHAVEWLAMAVPFVALSLLNANEGHPLAPLRLVLYRGWLIAAGSVVLYLLGWMLSENPAELSVTVVRILAVVPLVLMFAGMFVTARMGSGIGPFAAIAICGIAYASMVLATYELETQVLAPMMPDPAELQQIYEDAAAQGAAPVTSED